MKSRSHKTTSGWQQAHFCKRPFICTKIPFIGYNNPLVIPFVVKNRPLVGIQSISGFTLIELVVTLVVAGIVFALAVPSITAVVQNSRITSQGNDLIADFNLARSEAIKRNVNVVVCKSTNPTAATPTCNTVVADPWDTGRLVFVDGDPATGDNVYTAAAVDDVLLRRTESLTGNNSLTPVTPNTGLKNFVAYIPSGVTTLTRLTAGTTPYHFTVCDDRGVSYARGMVFEFTGRARIVRKSTFGALSCP